MHSILGLISFLVFTCTLPASGTPYFPLERDASSPPPTIGERAAAASPDLSLPETPATIEERDETTTSSTDVSLERRKGGGGGKGAGIKQDAEYTGSFGGLGLMGVGMGGIGGGGTIAIGATAALVLTAVAVVIVLAMAGWALFEWWKIVQEFHNDDTNNWPIYDEQETENNNHTISAAWSIRTFSDDGCGNPGLDSHGSHPYSQNHDNVPVMMTEYISSDLNYNDKKPCESFMISKNSEVNSVAVWMAESVTDQNPGVALFYSHPLCHVKKDSSKTGPGAAVNGTIPHKPYSGFPDYMAAYNGSYALYDSDDDKSFVPGQWACLKGRFLSFSIVFSGVTDATDPYTGNLTAADTVPNPDKRGVMKDVGEIKANHSFTTTDIADTYQVGSRGWQDL